MDPFRPPFGDVEEEGHLEMALQEVSLFPQEGEEEGVEETELLCFKLEMNFFVLKELLHLKTYY